MKMRYLRIIALAIILIFIAGCGGKANIADFKSKDFGFSFSFPKDWDENKKDLPNNWAILHNEDVILLTVNKAESENLLALGIAQALRDLYSGKKIDEISQESLDQIKGMVTLKSFNDKEWYTYALNFPEKNVNSIVSGTICDGNEVNIVLVSAYSTYEENKLIYSSMLESFKC
jgi:hypothetical protein